MKSVMGNRSTPSLCSPDAIPPKSNRHATGKIGGKPPFSLNPPYFQAFFERETADFSFLSARKRRFPRKRTSEGEKSPQWPDHGETQNPRNQLIERSTNDFSLPS
jgi:hypothetical protein